MNGVGIDTTSLLLFVDQYTARWIASGLPHQRTSARLPGASHHYGNFGDWSLTLHRQRPGLAASAVVLTASLPRLVYGENARPAGTLGSQEGLRRLSDRVAQRTGLELDLVGAKVCRVDYCATITPCAEVRELLAALQTARLPRRQRAIMDNGVSFHSQVAKETVYDKQREIAHTMSRIARRTSDTASIERFAALVRAERRLRHGAIRVECRLSGSKNIAKRLRLDMARPGLVLTTENAYEVVSTFISRIGPQVRRQASAEAARILCGLLGPIPGQRAFALLALTTVTGSLEEAAASLGMSHLAAARLVERARTAGVGSVSALHRKGDSALAFPAISVEWTDRFERRIQRRWHATQGPTSQASPNFLLTSAA